MSAIELNDPNVAGLISPVFASVSGSSVSAIAPPLGDGITPQTAATMALLCMNETGQNYKWYANNGTGGGLTDGHLQLFSYNTSTNWCAPVLDICPQNANNARTSIALPADLYFSANNGTGLHLSGYDSANDNLRGMIGIASQSAGGAVGDTFNVVGGYNNNFEIIRFPQSGAPATAVLAIDASDNVTTLGQINSCGATEVLPATVLPASSTISSAQTIGSSFTVQVSGNYLLAWDAVLVAPTWNPATDFLKLYLLGDGTPIEHFAIPSVPTSNNDSFPFSGTFYAALQTGVTYQFGIVAVGTPAYASNSGLSVTAIKLL